MAAGVSEGVDEKPTFTCASCGFKCHYEYFGKKPPFSKSIVLLEDAYTIHDPFSPNAGHVTLGGQCCLCALDICVSQTCSIFYTRRFCISCVQKNLGEFPDEILKNTREILEARACLRFPRADTIARSEVQMGTGSAKKDVSRR